MRSPSLRGSGLKSNDSRGWGRTVLSPSLRGSGLKCGWNCRHDWYPYVSLFTREWIEIFSFQSAPSCLSSPSLRGSGLKCVPSARRETMDLSPSLRGSGLKFCLILTNVRRERSPSLRGSGLKSATAIQHPKTQTGLPLYEGVD